MGKPYIGTFVVLGLHLSSNKCILGVHQSTKWIHYTVCKLTPLCKQSLCKQIHRYHDYTNVNKQTNT